MNEIIKQDINSLEYSFWLQAKTKKKTTIWKDREGYVFSCNFGVPTKVDAIFLYYLMLESQNQNWAENIILSKYKILNACGVAPSTKTYQRLEDSLEKWKFTGLRFQGTFYDGIEYQTLSFGIINDWRIQKENKKIKIEFNKFWIQKIKHSKFFKYIPFDQIKKLRSPLALRLYEILIKTFHYREKWEIDALKLAAKIPMSAKYFSDIFPRIQAATKRIAEKTDLKISVKVVKKGRGKGKFIFKKQSCKKLKQLEQTPEASIKIPDVVFNLIPKQHRKSCKKICEKIFKKDGEDGLKYYISKTNKKKKIDSYGGYLKTLFDLNLYADFQEKQKKIKQDEKEEQEKIEKAVEEGTKKLAQEKQERDDQQHKEKLIQNLSESDLEAFDEYILKQNLSSFEKDRFIKGKKSMLRLIYIEQYISFCFSASKKLTATSVSLPAHD